MEIIKEFAENFWCMFIDMSFYIMLGLFFVGVFHTYVKKEKVLKHLGDDNFSSVVKSSMVGVPLPLCSCGVVPTAIELKKSGASHGSVISFLISTPQTGIDNILATYSMMGGVMAIFRPIAAFISGIIGGVIINIFGKNEVMNLEHEVSCGCGGHGADEHSHEHTHEEENCCSTTHEHEHGDSCCCSTTHEHEHEDSCCCSSEHTHEHEDSCCCSSEHTHEHEDSCCCSAPEVVAVSSGCGCGCESSSLSEGSKIKQVFAYAYGGFLDELAGHFLIGMLLATCITTFLPADFFVSLGINKGILSMIAMMFVGLPMYICSTASIPIAMSLMTKGLSFGGAFVFLFTGPVTNMVSLLMLGKILGKKITALYVGSVMICAIMFGLVLDFLIDNYGLVLYSFSENGGMDGHHENAFTLIIAVVFAVLIVKGVVVTFINKRKMEL